MSEIVEVLSEYVTAVYTYAHAAEPPASGAEWPDEQDYPGVRVEIRLPTDSENELLAEELVDTACFAAGQPLSTHWGSRGPAGAYRRIWLTFREPTLREAFNKARAWALGASLDVDRVAAPRLARLARRERTIAAALSVTDTVTAD